MNGVKQGGVLSPVLFAVYTDGLLLRFQESRIGCHMGGHYAGALAYADDIILISPSMTGLWKMSSICEQYASEYDILFNGSRVSYYFSNAVVVMCLWNFIKTIKILWIEQTSLITWQPCLNILYVA